MEGCAMNDRIAIISWNGMIYTEMMMKARGFEGIMCFQGLHMISIL